MQYPDSESTPKSKVKPLKSKDEFSSLHKRLRPVKDPLTSPRAVHAPALRKPNISGSNTVFSSLSQPSRKGSNDHPRKTLGHGPAHAGAHGSGAVKKFRCRLIPYRSEAKLLVTRDYLKIGSTKIYASSGPLLEYALLEDRTAYMYSAKVKDRVKAAFILADDDQVPFKNECMQMGVRLKNVGGPMAPKSTRIESQEAAKPREPLLPEPAEFAATLLACEPIGDKTVLGKPATVLTNDNGITLASPPFRLFKWSETEFKVVDRNIHSHNAAEIQLEFSSPKTLAVFSFAIPDFHRLQRYIDERGTNKLNEPPLPESPTSFPDSSRIAHERSQHSSPPWPSAGDKPRGGLDFGTIEPLNFYSSPPSKPAFSGSKLPNTASSPKFSTSSRVTSTDSPSGESDNGSPRNRRASIFDQSPMTPKRNHLANITRPVIPEIPSRPTQPAAENTQELTTSDKERESERAEPIILGRNGTPVKSPGRKPRRTRTQIDFTEEEEELVEPTDEDFALLKAEGYKGVDYEFWDGKRTTVGVEDIARLNPRIYVNDNIIWFFLRRYMENLVKKDGDASDQIMMLDTFFYYRMRSGADPPAWVSRMPILDKRIIIMPIHEQAHWRVAVIIGLDRLSNLTKPRKASVSANAQFKTMDSANDKAAGSPISSQDEGSGHEGGQATNGGDNDTEISNFSVRPTVVILDSLGPTHIYPTVRKVVTVLGNVARIQKRPVPVPADFRSLRAAVPTQTNLTDCGVFLLHYVEQILMHLDEFMKSVAATENRVLNMREEFWKPDELYSKRENFKSELKQMGNVDDVQEVPSGASSRRNSDYDEPSVDEDSIEVLGMEVVKKKRRTNDHQPPVEAAAKVHLSGEDTQAN